MYSLSNRGAPMLLKSSNEFSVYFGKTFNDDSLYAKYYRLKKKLKLRLLYTAKKPIWDGYYYFGLNEEEYQKYIPEKNGRFKQKIKFDIIHCYKIYEEAFVCKSTKYVFRLKLNEDRGIAFSEENFETRNIELCAKRDSKGEMKPTCD